MTISLIEGASRGQVLPEWGWGSVGKVPAQCLHEALGSITSDKCVGEYTCNPGTKWRQEEGKYKAIFAYLVSV